MSNWLLLTDTHFTDNALEEYRWNIFKELLHIAAEHDITEIVNLGDVVDRKDKHSSVLVNRLVEEFSYLQSHTKANITILQGNHDTPVNGPSYWKFLNKLGIPYIMAPTLYKNVWLLPFSSNPKDEWKEIVLGTSTAIMMHQTGQGATVEGERELSSHSLPNFPVGVPVFSGDVHRPQTANGIVYIGVPHPVRFSETWANRIIVVKNDNFDDYADFWIKGMRRSILDIKSAADLAKTDYKAGDQVRIRFSLSAKDLTAWPQEQEKIKQWASSNGVLIASTEAVLIGDGVKANTTEQAQALELMKPEEIVKQFSITEKLGKDVTKMGLALIKLA